MKTILFLVCLIGASISTSSLAREVDVIKYPKEGNEIGIGDHELISYTFKGSNPASATITISVYDINSEGLDYKLIETITDDEGTITFKPDKTEALGLIVTYEGDGYAWMLIEEGEQEDPTIDGYPVILLLTMLLVIIFLTMFIRSKKK